MSDSRSPRVDRYKRRPRSVLTGDASAGDRGWSSEPPDAEPMYPPGWSLERELGERRQAGSRGARAAPPAPERPTGPVGPTGPPPRPERPSSPHERGTAGRGPSNRQLLHRALSSAQSTRQAILLREVLGPPVSLRTDREDRPS